MYIPFNNIRLKMPLQESFLSFLSIEQMYGELDTEYQEDLARVELHKYNTTIGNMFYDRLRFLLCVE